MKSADKIFVFICIILVISMGIGVYALPYERFSEDENRVLSDAPSFSAERLASGAFFEGLSRFYADRIPLRRTLVRGKAVCELALGKRQNNGVLFLSGGRLADRCEYKSTDALLKNLDALAAISDSVRTQYMLVPRSIDVYTDLQSSANVTRQVLSSGLDSGSLYTALKAQAESGISVYYKTDHHLTAKGAYVLYRETVSSLGGEAYESEDFYEQTVCSDFFGSAYSSSGLLPISADSITLYRYDGDGSLCVSCEDKGCELSSLYCFDELEHKDKYKVFQGGNHGVINIESSGEERQRLLVVKDSFANAVLPLLARHFDLTVIDPRYADIYVPEDTFACVVIMGIDTLAQAPLFD